MLDQTSAHTPKPSTASVTAAACFNSEHDELDPRDQAEVEIALDPDRRVRAERRQQVDRRHREEHPLRRRVEPVARREERREHRERRGREAPAATTLMKKTDSYSSRVGSSGLRRSAAPSPASPRSVPSARKNMQMS